MKTTKLLVSLVIATILPGLGLRVKAQTAQNPLPPAAQVGVTTDEEMRRDLEQARQDAEQSHRQMEQAQKMAPVQSSGGGGGGNPMDLQLSVQKMALMASQDRLKKLTFMINGAPEQPLVIASSEITPAVLAELNEDLNVMARLVDDAVTGDRDDLATRHAMGIAVNLNLSFPGGAGTARPLYINGYGAVFEMSVPFLLAPSANGKSDIQSRPNKNSAWDNARRELYARPGDDADLTEENDTRNAYSTERVESLKQSILKALTNAGNLRHLKANERVTVVVLSRGEAKPWLYPLPGFPGKQTAAQAKAPGTTLTLSIQKSDADELAAGRISDSDFRKRAAIALY